MDDNEVLEEIKQEFDKDCNSLNAIGWSAYVEWLIKKIEKDKG